MPTKFSYWYLKGRSFPKFERGDKPKEYLEQWFTTRPRTKGNPPVHEDDVTASEVLEAGLAAGYGKESTWSRTLLMSKPERTSLYGYLRRRLQATYECLEISADGIALKSFWRGIEPSEKASLSFAIGSLAALLGARRWVIQFGQDRTVKRFLHARLFVDPAIVKHPLGKIPTDGDSMPDFLVEDSAGEWHVFEAKGGDHGNRWRQLAQGVQQAKRVKRVGPVGALKAPESAVCVQTVVAKSSTLELTLVDPPSDPTHPVEGPDDVDISFVSELLELSIILDTIEWFGCLRDLPMPDEFVPAASLRMTTATARSRAFGGLLLAVPHEYLDREAQIRKAARMLTTLARLLQGLNGLDLVDDAEQSVQRLNGAARARLNNPHLAELDDEDALRQIASIRLPDRDVFARAVWLDEFVKNIHIGNDRVVDLVSRLKSVREEATAEFLKHRGGEDPMWASVVVTSGGMAAWLYGDHEKQS